MSEEPEKTATWSRNYARAAVNAAQSAYYAAAARDAAQQAVHARDEKKERDFIEKAARDTKQSVYYAKAAKDEIGEHPEAGEDEEKDKYLKTYYTSINRRKSLRIYHSNVAEAARDSLTEANTASDEASKGNYVEAVKHALKSVYYAEAARDEAQSVKYAEAARDETQSVKYAEAAKDETQSVKYAEAARDEARNPFLANTAKDLCQNDNQLSVTQFKEKMKEKMEAELKRVQQFAKDVTLDPKTAHPDLILFDYGKQVNYGDVRKTLPDNLERFTQFTQWFSVLGQQSFSSGKFYFEVQVKGKTAWDLGVARESVDRKGTIRESPLYGFWTIWLRNGNQYSKGEDTSVLFPLHPGPEKVGVFVDYDQGLVSFYDVDAAALIYSFTGCCFKEKLYPYFNPCNNVNGTNSAPLIICPVDR